MKRHVYYDMQGRKHASISAPPPILERLIGLCVFILVTAGMTLFISRGMGR